MASRNGRFTPTEQRMLDVLQDGLPHTREEIWECLQDDYAAIKGIRLHISNIRVKLLTRGQTIVCELHRGKPHYRQVRLLRGED